MITPPVHQTDAVVNHRGRRRKIVSVAQCGPRSCGDLIKESLTLVESERLVALERDIEAGQQTYVKTGNALAEIRDKGLYKAKFKTFDDYCRKKWGFKRAYAYKLIEAAAIATGLSTVGYIPSERVAREIGKVPKVQCKEIYKSALAKANCEGRKLTAKDISDTSRPDSRFFQQHESCPLVDSVVTFYRVHDFPISKIIRSSEVPNFKIGADPLTGIVPGQELHGEFITIGAAPLVIWLRRNGIFELITGRHRLDLAKRRGKIAIAVHIAREDQGFTAADAKRFDAHSNIRDGQGTTEDYAHYFKNSPSLTEADAKDQGLFCRAKGRDGWSLGKMTCENVYALWQAGKIDERQAVAIATTAPGEVALQSFGVRIALEGEKPEVVAESMRAKAADAVSRNCPKAAQSDFFADTGLDEQYKAEGRFVSKAKATLQDQIIGRKAILRKFDQTTNTGSVTAERTWLEQELSKFEFDLRRWNDWRSHPDLKAKFKGEITNQPDDGKVALAA